MADLHGEARTLCRILIDAGFPTMLAGGCVRDRLMGFTPKDYDLATAAPPETCMAVFPRHGYKVAPTGIEHGTVTVVTAAQPVEVTTLREDVACFGRHAAVEFSEDFEGDAHRRDFTVNALFENVDGEIVDYVGGREDLAAQRLRFVGDADARIQEDYLRALRYYRFLARWGWSADTEAEAAIRRNSAGLQQLSAERVQKELELILTAPHGHAMIPAMSGSNVLQELFPWFDQKQVEPVSYVLRELHAVEEAGPVLRWFVLLYMAGATQPDEAEIKRRVETLRFSRSHKRGILGPAKLFQAYQAPAEALKTIHTLCVRHDLQPRGLLYLVNALEKGFKLKMPKLVHSLLDGLMRRPPPQYPGKAVLRLPPKERGGMHLLITIAWYLKIWDEPEQISQIIEQRAQYWDNLEKDRPPVPIHP